MPITVINGLKMNYEILRATDRGPEVPRETLVVIHGIVIDNLASYYLTIAPAIAASGIDVIMFDHRGHGKSEKIVSGYQLENIVDDLAKLLDQIHDGTPVHLAGNSYGGTVAYAFALSFPERIASLSSLEAEPPTQFWSDSIAHTFRQNDQEMNEVRTMDRVFTDYGQGGTKMLKNGRRMAAETKFFEELPYPQLVADDAIKDLQVPLLAIYGSESSLVAQEPKVRELVNDVKTVIFPGVGHSVLTDAPRLLERELIDWVLSHPVGSAQGQLLQAQS
ncbi:putative hydrolase [Renibacterium salmoninarum ATCC 33209]|uniref:Putative hydrolase n=1 Tax=Renibacterium salmoninarum (strain ATCC 33209 / DSM 20767 / JCM 11484 / NBRC 15589 / NCIMB 2235) TaxID=288705 RepID=A9WRI8_RENSM|nr:alpha/beta hydrolase [Renibacterium salmoninarum]ABY24270.1 putative hydrolase [Renibacterium salmoninarum ATCC 33209]